MTTWQISESGTEVALGPQGTGEVTLVVTNTGEAQDRSVLSVTALDGAADAWFTVEEPQRLVPAKQTASYVVKIAVPTGTAAGSFGFQATAYSADRDPGETSTQSRRIAITVAPTPAPSKPKFPWAVVVAVVLLLAVVGVVLALVFGKDDEEIVALPTTTTETTVDTTLRNTTEPELTGTAEVLQVLQVSNGAWSRPESPALNYTVTWLRCADPVGCTEIEGAHSPQYTVTSEDVTYSLKAEVTAYFGDESATAESAETTIVAAPPPVPATVPSVVGLPYSEADSAVRAAGLVLRSVVSGEIDFDCDGIVQTQDPGAGTSLLVGDEVIVVTRPLALFCFDYEILFPPIGIDPGYIPDDFFEFDLPFEP